MLSLPLLVPGVQSRVGHLELLNLAVALSERSLDLFQDFQGSLHIQELVCRALRSAGAGSPGRTSFALSCFSNSPAKLPICGASPVCFSALPAATLPTKSPFWWHRLGRRTRRHLNKEALAQNLCCNLSNAGNMIRSAPDNPQNPERPRSPDTKSQTPNPPTPQILPEPYNKTLFNTQENPEPFMNPSDPKPRTLNPSTLNP